MDAIEFLKEHKRMCNTYKNCYSCPLANIHCIVNHLASDDNNKKNVDVVEQWSKEHPRKTRQSVFLKQYPKAVISNGVLDLTPCNIDQSLYDIQRCNDADCYECRREFWMQEVE